MILWVLKPMFVVLFLRDWGQNRPSAPPAIFGTGARRDNWHRDKRPSAEPSSDDVSCRAPMSARAQEGTQGQSETHFLYSVPRVKHAHVRQTQAARTGTTTSAHARAAGVYISMSPAASRPMNIPYVSESGPFSLRQLTARPRGQ